jgi:hypothetical protein
MFKSREDASLRCWAQKHGAIASPHTVEAELFEDLYNVRKK